MYRTIEGWKGVDTQKVAGTCSPAHIENLLKDAIADIAELEDFVRSFLDPERNGHAVNGYVRDQARRLLGMRESEVCGFPAVVTESLPQDTIEVRIGNRVVARLINVGVEDAN